MLQLKLSPHEKKLITFLGKAGRPISKEELFEVIWGEKVEDKTDLSRLMTLVSRLKARTGIEIRSIKGSYLLIPAALEVRKTS